MESVIIVAPRNYDSMLRARLDRLGPIRVSASGEWIVEDGKSRAYLARNDSVSDELEPERLKAIVSKVANPIFDTIDFSDISLCKIVMLALVDDSELLVDDDHGRLLSGTDFVRELTRRPEWDWRKDGVEPLK